MVPAGRIHSPLILFRGGRWSNSSTPGHNSGEGRALRLQQLDLGSPLVFDFCAGSHSPTSRGPVSPSNPLSFRSCSAASLGDTPLVNDPNQAGAVETLEPEWR
jgi:hypothetical protein